MKTQDDNQLLKPDHRGVVSIDLSLLSNVVAEALKLDAVFSSDDRQNYYQPVGSEIYHGCIEVAVPDEHLAQMELDGSTLLPVNAYLVSESGIFSVIGEYLDFAEPGSRPGLAWLTQEKTPSLLAAAENIRGICHWAIEEPPAGEPIH